MTWYEEMKKESDRLQAVIDQAVKSYSQAPEGDLLLDRKYFRFRLNGRINYIPKKNKELIRALAQKRYDWNILKISLKQKKLIDEFLSKYDFLESTKYYENFNPLLKDITNAYGLPDTSNQKDNDVLTFLNNLISSSNSLLDSLRK